MKKINFTITIEQVKSETFEIELQAQTALEALDLARQMVEERNKVAPQGTYSSVVKVTEA